MRRTLSVLATALLLVGAAAWFALLRPPFLGGATSYVLVSGQSMEPTLHTGDLVLARRSAAYRKGDVVAYRIPSGDPGAGSLVIHRIVGGSAAAGYRVQGDNRDRPDLWRPRPEQIVGRSWHVFPAGGRWLALLRSPLVLALAAAWLTYGWLGVTRPTLPFSARRTRAG